MLANYHYYYSQFSMKSVAMGCAGFFLHCSLSVRHHHLVTTTRGNQTSLVITKDEAELWCVTTEDVVPLGILLVLSTAITCASGYILIIHLIFPELRNTIGKLLIIQSVAMILLQVSNVAH